MHKYHCIAFYILCRILLQLSFVHYCNIKRRTCTSFGLLNMPPFKSIGSLSDICTDWVWRWLFHCLKHQAKPEDRLQQRQYVISTLNPNVRQQLLNRICGSHMYRVSLSSKCFLIEMLGDKSTHCLDLSQSGLYYIDEIFQFYRTLTFGLLLSLTKLGIKCNVSSLNDQKLLPDLNITFYRVFNQMGNLRWVTLTGVGDTPILCTLGSNCHHLEYLDISGSPYVKDESIARLLVQDSLALCGRSLEQISRQELATTPLCKTLSIVCVSGTDITMVSAIILLHYLPRLTSLGGQIDCGSVCEVIRLLQPETDNQDVSSDGPKVFEFEELSDSCITPENASLLCLSCPKVKRLTTTMINMQSLHVLHPLQSLTIEDMRGDPLYIYNYLQMRGDSLKELILCDNLTCPLDLTWIMELTPNLEQLRGNICIDDSYEVPNWDKLLVATVTVNSSKVLLELLTHAPGLRELSIDFLPEPYSETSDCINDNLIIYIALKGGLKCVEKLVIKECAISIKGIDCLLIHCPELWYLAPVSFWHNVSEDDVKRLRTEAVENNWKLKIVVYHDWEAAVWEN
ncbi:hypothetical protein SK128_009005 [Halocaridina rubra]|uniref:Uncharacterized protein n=1 Tax=Halocaridina rubra TaxID=373956 RepID=A0AAN8WRZ3_HALRR